MGLNLPPPQALRVSVANKRKQAQVIGERETSTSIMASGRGSFSTEQEDRAIQSQIKQELYQ